MNVLMIKYVRGRALFRSTEKLSVFIDGEPAGKISDEEELSFELTDGRHEVVARCGHCKKVIELHMEGDDSFIISWDWVTGGLMVCDDIKSYFATERRRNYWLYIALFSLIILHIVNVSLHYGRYISGELFVTLEIVYLAALLFLLIPLAIIRGRRVIRGSEVRG